MIGSWMKSGRGFQTVGPATEKAQRPTQSDSRKERRLNKHCIRGGCVGICVVVTVYVWMYVCVDVCLMVSDSAALSWPCYDT